MELREVILLLLQGCLCSRITGAQNYGTGLNYFQQFDYNIGGQGNGNVGENGGAGSPAVVYEAANGAPENTGGTYEGTGFNGGPSYIDTGNEGVNYQVYYEIGADDGVNSEGNGGGGGVGVADNSAINGLENAGRNYEETRSNGGWHVYDYNADPGNEGTNYQFRYEIGGDGGGNAGELGGTGNAGESFDGSGSNGGWYQINYNAEPVNKDAEYQFYYEIGKDGGVNAEGNGGSGGVSGEAAINGPENNFRSFEENGFNGGWYEYNNNADPGNEGIEYEFRYEIGGDGGGNAGEFGGTENAGESYEGSGSNGGLLAKVYNILFSFY